MINAALMKKELRETAWKHVLALAVLSAIGVTLPFVFDWLGKFQVEIGGALGEAYRRQMSDFTLYMWANWYGKNLYQMLVIYAVVVGMAQLAGESARRTAGFLFSKPLGREAIYRTKFIAGASAMIAVMTVATGLTYLAVFAAGKEVPVLFMAGLVVNAAGLLLIYSLALMFSVLFDDQLKAGAAAFGTALVLGIPGWIPGWGMYSIYRQMHAWPVYTGDGFQLGAIVIMLPAAWIFYRIGLSKLLKKDF